MTRHFGEESLGNEWTGANNQTYKQPKENMHQKHKIKYTYH